jgi:hypothetical protein
MNPMWLPLALLATLRAAVEPCGVVAALGATPGNYSNMVAASFQTC